MTTQDENLRFLIKSSLLPVILSFSFLSLALWNIEPEQSKTIEKDFCHSGFDNSCSSSTSTSKWNWELDDPHRCNIEKISLSQLPLHFPPLGVLPPLYYKPIIIVDDTQQRNSKFQDITSKDGILEALTPSFPITLSSSNSFSDYRRTTTLEQYINETIISETLPNHLSNESWYLFGETYSEEWKTSLLNYYTLPPCRTCDRSLSALSFGIGNKGSGVQWHIHGPGFSESLHGRKHWLLYPPSQPPSFDANFTSRHWMEHMYTSLVDKRDNGRVNEKGGKEKNHQENEHELPWECTLYPGEMIYFPDMWYHATLNLDTYTAFVSTFTTEHYML